MRKSIALLFATALCLLPAGQTLRAQTEARETQETLTTYPFGDPNPIPVFGKIYPYYRFDGLTATSEPRKWTVVTLENPYLRVKIMPEIGGKVWSVVDKKSGGELFYDNDAVKFRNIALRGPWTSGGIEFNYGLIGHAPSCSSPVDYKIVSKSDDSKSCFIGVLDLMTRTRWTVEINLPKDKAWFTTRCYWHNQAGDFMPYYCWFNTGVTATDDLHLIFPGDHYLGHEGSTADWPMDTVNHRDLQYWRNLNFGFAKSMHVSGTTKPFFGTYYDNQDYGMLHLAKRDDKLGRKFFTWALSDEGDIWRELLTDNKPQYVELQSGRLYNQNAVESNSTGYQQYLFPPYATDDWTEYWTGYSGTHGAEDASRLGVVNMEERSDGLQLYFYPLQSANGVLSVKAKDGKELLHEALSLKPAELVRRNFNGLKKADLQQVALGGNIVWTAESQNPERPRNPEAKFNFDTPYGNYMLARDYLGMRYYADARQHVEKSLAGDSLFVPSLAIKAALLNHEMHYAGALSVADRALSFDQYHPMANYEAALAALHLGKTYVALDRLQLCALTYELRDAAYTELSKLYFSRLHDYVSAREYAEKALRYDSNNFTACQMLALTAQAEGNEQAYRDALDRLRTLDPLNHFADAEDYLQGRLQKADFLKTLRSEMPEQDLMETAMFYYRLGMKEQALRLLDLDSTGSALVGVWKAYLRQDASLLNSLSQAKLDFVFPFREESLDALSWAEGQSSLWQVRYLKALLFTSVDRKDEARQLVAGIGKECRYAPFYVYRAQLSPDAPTALADLQQANTLQPREWRYVRELAKKYNDQHNYRAALRLEEPYYRRNPENFQITSLYATTLLLSEQFKKADRVIDRMHILPFEGSVGGHNLLRMSKMMQALQAIRDGHLDVASEQIEAQTKWPHNLGSGKPYDDLLDYRMENYLRAIIAQRKGRTAEAQELLQKVAENKVVMDSNLTLLQAAVCHQLGNESQVESLMSRWKGQQSAEDFVRAIGSQPYTFDYDRLAKLFKSTMAFEDTPPF